MVFRITETEQQAQQDRSKNMYDYGLKIIKMYRLLFDILFLLHKKDGEHSAFFKIPSCRGTRKLDEQDTPQSSINMVFVVCGTER